MSIQKATKLDVKIIHDIAHATWHVTYGQTHTREQLDYMLEKFYSETALLDDFQIKNYLIYIEENKVLGFASYENNCPTKNSLKIHRLYILPSAQGKGIGKKMIDEITFLAKNNNSHKLILNVNRLNKAKLFYEKLGFKVIDAVNIDIGNNYLMEDFVMEKSLY